MKSQAFWNNFEIETLEASRRSRANALFLYGNFEPEGEAKPRWVVSQPMRLNPEIARSARTHVAVGDRSCHVSTIFRMPGVFLMGLLRCTS